jgi:dihydropteroate synthase
MQIHKLSSSVDIKKYLKNLGVDGGGVSILSSKSEIHLMEIKNLKVGGANILKQDALSVGADLAVPKGTVIAKEPFVDCLLMATTSQLMKLSKKELAQPFGLKDIALYLQKTLKIKKIKNVELMGVINANDDSFFADSRFKNKDAIVSIKKMIKDGASIIDIGGVSSAPNSSIVDVEIELQRIKPICDLIKKEKLYEKVDFSIDSYEPKVIEYALKSGFKIVNDITGLENDEVCKITAKYEARVVIMHMQGTPKTMQDNPTYENILDEVYEFFEKRIQKAKSYNIQDLVLDVGIGFGKTLEHNLMLIKNLETFKTLNYPLLVGASRKSMIDKISSSKVSQRLSGTLTLHNEAVKNGASILRVHDVFEHAQALRVLKALENMSL